MKRTWILFAAFCLSPLLAAEPVEELPDIDITVQRYRQPKADVAQSVTVLGPADLAVVGGASVKDALRGVPGVDLRPQGAAGAQIGLSLRGSRTEQVLILIDGRRVNNAQGGGVDLTDLPLHDVERIEILRGGGSALYGSDPVGGVINIVTRQGGPGQLDLATGYGSFDSHWFRAATGDQVGRGQYRVNLERYFQVGDFAFEDNTGATQHRAGNQFHRWSMRGEAGYDFGRAGELTGGASAYFATKGIPGMVSFPTPGARQRNTRYDVHLAHRLPLGSGELTATTYYQTQELDYEDLANFFPTDAHHENDLFSVELLHTLEVAGRGRAVLGLDYRRDDIRSNTDGRHHRLTAGMFGLYEIDLGPVRLVPSARLDGQTGQQPIFSPKFALLAEPTRSLTVRAGVGRSFRAPSFDDLYWPADPFSSGNPNLRSEHATEWEVGGEWRPTRACRLETTYYNRATTDLILWQPDTTGLWTPQNIGQVRFQGIETAVALDLPLPGLSLRGGHHWLKATTHSGAPAELGKQLVGHPFHQGSGGLRYQRGPWLCDLSVVAVGRRYTTADNTASLPPQALLNAAVRVKTSELDYLSLTVNNLLDTSTRAVVDYPLPGLEVQVEAGHRF